LRMGAGQAAAGRPLGATVEVRLQRHGASGRGTMSKRHCSNSFFFLLLLLLLYIFFYLWGPKNELQQGRSKDSLHRSSSAHHPSSAKLYFEFLFSQYQHQGEHRKALYWFNMIIFFGYMCMKNYTIITGLCEK